MENLTQAPPGTGPEDLLYAWIETLPIDLNLKQILHQLECRFLVRALRHARGVQAEAARKLQISRSDMAYKVKKFDLDV